jgi:predicted nucleic acid-binding protein
VRAVVDASAAFVMLTLPQRAAPAFTDVTDIIAPELIVAELLNARWKIARTGAPAPSLSSMLEFLERIRLVGSLPYAAAAALLAERLDHPLYDCLYAVIAQRGPATLVTADRRFAGKLDGDVRLITLQ